MTSSIESAILAEKIGMMAFSKEFKESSAKMGYATLRQIVSEDPAILQKKDGFNYIWLGELLEFLTENNLLHLLQSTQGNNGI
ncbi:hypothetical protein AB6735_24415 [Mucilaginibacter sp. RCC_168]|uniref:hypothetical protein n=1 Tax=Mucilaginibacter sp. RCC_168 TaxID=3239221 RepID=UPI003523B628